MQTEQDFVQTKRDVKLTDLCLKKQRRDFIQTNADFIQTNADFIQTGRDSLLTEIIIIIDMEGIAAAGAVGTVDNRQTKAGLWVSVWAGCGQLCCPRAVHALIHDPAAGYP